MLLSFLLQQMHNYNNYKKKVFRLYVSKCVFSYHLDFSLLNYRMDIQLDICQVLSDHSVRESRLKYFCRNQFILQICKFNCDVKQYVCSNFLHYLMHKYNNYNKRVFRQYVFGYEFACVALFQIFFDKVDTCNLFGPYKLVHSVISTNMNV